MQMDTPESLSLTTRLLHWVIALSIISLLAVGIYMEEAEAYALYPLHKASGVLIFALVLARVAWRIRNGWPAPVGQHAAWELGLARAVHWVLITGTVLMPISGFLMSALGGHGVDVFGLELVARNPDPADAEKVLAHNADLAGLSHSVHGIVGTVMVVAVVLHVAGAVKHHVLDKDATLRRMLGI